MECLPACSIFDQIGVCATLSRVFATLSRVCATLSRGAYSSTEGCRRFLGNQGMRLLCLLTLRLDPCRVVSDSTHAGVGRIIFSRDLVSLQIRFWYHCTAIQNCPHFDQGVLHNLDQKYLSKLWSTLNWWEQALLCLLHKTLSHGAVGLIGSFIGSI